MKNEIKIADKFICVAYIYKMMALELTVMVISYL